MTHVFIWTIVSGLGLMTTVLQNAIVEQSEIGNLDVAKNLLVPMWLLTGSTAMMAILGLVVGYNAIKRAAGF